MAAYEILLLNTAIPQIQAAQSGDTYLCPRELAVVVNTATDAVRITQTGTGNALLVEDSANPDSTPFVVTATGDVGIGVSSPGAKLNVQSTGIQGLFQYDASNQILVFHSGSNGYVGTLTNQPLILRTNNTDRATLDASGNLGLGVTPSASWNNIFKAMQIGSASYLSVAAQTTATARGSILWNAIGSGDESFVYSKTGDPANRFMVGSGLFAWYTAGNGTAGDPISFTQAMTLDALGNLGVGTTTLNVGTYGKAITLAATASAYGGLELSGTTGGAIDFQTSQSTRQVQLLGNSNGFVMLTNGGSGLAERARITSGGYFKASNGGTYQDNAGPYHELYKSADNGDWAAVVTHAGATAGNQYGLKVDLTGDPNGAGNEFLYCEGASTLRASIRSNGGIANYQANDANLSDRREKTNFAPAKSYLDTICAIPVQTFNYIDQSEDDPGLTIGVVAQDVQAVAPELVTESNWGTKDDPKMRLSIYQTDLQYALMKALQELKSELDSVKAELAALKGA